MTVKMLTMEEFKADNIVPDFHYIKVRNDSWSAVHRQMINKWIEAHLGAGWCYWDGSHTYIFQKAADWMLFKMWIKSEPFDDEDGEISGPK
jgi:hypothetical protein